MRKFVDWVRRLARSDHASPFHRLHGVVPRVEELESRLVPSTFTIANFGPAAGAGAGLYFNSQGSPNTWVNISPGVNATEAVVDAQGDVLAEFTAASGAKFPGLQLFNPATGTWTLLSSDQTTDGGTEVNEGLKLGIAVGKSGQPVIVASFATGGGFMGGLQETTDGGAHWTLLTQTTVAASTAALATGLDVDENGDVVVQFGGTVPGIQYYNASTGKWSQISNLQYGPGENTQIRMDAKGDVVAEFKTGAGGLQTISHDDAIDGSKAINSWTLLPGTAGATISSFSIGDDGTVVATFTGSAFGDIQLLTKGASSWTLLDSKTFNDDAQIRIDKDGNVVENQDITASDSSAGLFFLPKGGNPTSQWVQMSFSFVPPPPPAGDGGPSTSDWPFEVGSK